MKYRTPTKRFSSSKETSASDLPKNQVWEWGNYEKGDRNTSHSHECFPPTEHKAFSLKAGTILVTLRIAEARHVNHLLRVTQYNMVLSALWPCFSSAYLALLCCLDNVLIDNRLSNPTEPCKSQPTSCLALTDSGAGGCCQHNTDAGNLIVFTH